MQQNELQIVISEDGTISMIDGDAARVISEDLGVAAVSRASHVEPASRPLRLLFHFIRERVSDDSRLAQWTRGWSCLWQVTLSDAFGGHTLPETCRDREEAIAREVRYLNEAFTR